MTLDKLIYFFPILQVVSCFGASVTYALNSDLKHSLYWLLAGCLTLVVTWMK